MFSKSPKDKFVEQAQDLAQDLAAAIVPHIERARDELAPRIAEAREQVGPRLTEAREQLGPRLAEARDELRPRLAEARDQLAPHVEDVRGRLVKGAAAATTAATAAAAPAAAEAKSRAEDAADAVQGESEDSGGGKKKYLFLAGVLGLGAFAAKKLRGDKSSNWQTSYAPAPPPATPPAPSTTASSTTGPSTTGPSTAGASTSGVPSQPVGVSADSMVEEPPVGASPGESLSDAAEAPHPVTTPDSPAENVDVTEVADPDKR